jgi:hypothetical protein
MTMRRGVSQLISIVLVLVMGAALTTCPWTATPVRAGSTGVLKLHVVDCVGMYELTDARVDVLIHRPDGGTVGSGTGYTNGSGYVEFTFGDLENNDEAHVTVTPSGQSPDSNHMYYWIVPQGRSSGYWDLSFLGDSLCQDGWYDQKNDIIECVYH